MNPKPTFVEVVPLAADPVGIHLLSGQRLLRAATPLVEGGGDSFAESRLLLTGPVRIRLNPEDPDGPVVETGALGVDDDDLAVLHGTSRTEYTSDREVGSQIRSTFVAVVRCDGLVGQRWPGAWLLSPQMVRAMPPEPHGAAEAPTGRDLDVVHHAVRHLALLMIYDAGAAAALGGPDSWWGRHLAGLTPSLTRMYSYGTAA